MPTGHTDNMTKLQGDYSPHDADDLDQGWSAVREYLGDAILIAFDGCHKIYLAMDEAEADYFRKNYRDESVANNGVVEVGDGDYCMDVVETWFDSSCSLRFVTAVWHNEQEPNDGFVRLISQFAEWKC